MATALGEPDQERGSVEFGPFELRGPSSEHKPRTCLIPPGAFPNRGASLCASPRENADEPPPGRTLVGSAQPSATPPDLAQFDYQAQGVVDCSFIAKGLSDIRVQENEIRARVVALRILAAYPSPEQLAQIIFGA